MSLFIVYAVMSTDCCKAPSVSVNASIALLLMFAIVLVSSISLLLLISISATLFSSAFSLVTSLGPKFSKAGLRSIGSDVKF